MKGILNGLTSNECNMEINLGLVGKLHYIALSTCWMYSIVFVHSLVISSKFLYKIKVVRGFHSNFLTFSIKIRVKNFLKSSCMAILFFKAI